MSASLLEIVTDDEVLRAQKVAAARKQLKNFRATRSSATASSQSSSLSTPSSKSKSPSPAPPLPLSEGHDNCPSLEIRPRTLKKGKSKEMLLEGTSEQVPRLRKPKSKGSLGGHRRQQSSMSGHAPVRPSVIGIFDIPAATSLPNQLSDRLGESSLAIMPPRAIITPATPMTEEPDVFSMFQSQSPFSVDPEDKRAVQARLSTFSFGAKPVSRSPSPNGQSPFWTSQAEQERILPLGSPSASVSAPSGLHSLATPSSRPPSLLLTRPTPFAFGSPSAPTSSRNSLSAGPGSPTTPPSPARKRHSHNRSNSISLPNLKLASRPPSLGIPSSPNYPSSPCSPSGGSEGRQSRIGAQVNGQRLKFEPSGRGAEAEKEKDEYRRKALEKLTGGGRTPPAEEPRGAEISLPELDDDDESVASSTMRPLSGAFSAGFTFGRPNSLSLPSLLSSSSSPSGSLSASPFSWSSPEEDATERWSGFGVPAFPKEEGLGFGMELGLGMGKRASVTSALSVLAEVDEAEDDEEADAGALDEEDCAVLPAYPAQVVSSEPADSAQSTIIAPTPIRLRELTLLSSTPARPIEDTTPSRSSGSPTKGYGAIGRGRPRPLSGISPGVMAMALNGSPAISNMSTPKAATSLKSRRRPAPGSWSRGSSISYKRDGDNQSDSSRDWSISSRNFGSPTGMADIGSPPMSFASPPNWGDIPRPAKRPCPRPQSLAGLGAGSKGAGRILSEVEEAEEEDLSERMASFRFALDDLETPARQSSELDSTSRDSFDWRDSRLETVLERDALKEDVKLWRVRCRALEEKLEGERRESGVLRERVRKCE